MAIKIKNTTFNLIKLKGVWFLTIAKGGDAWLLKLWGKGDVKRFQKMKKI